MTSVSLIQADSYSIKELKQSLITLLEPLGGIKAFVKKDDRVLLKPNFLTASRPTKECITRREIVYCVAQLVLEAGGKPFLGDSPAFGTARGVAAANGYLPLMEELNLPIVEFTGQRYQTNSNNFKNLRLSQEALEADVVINLPKVKSHMQLTLTLGVKNLFGCVPGKMKAWWHMEAGSNPEYFASMLVETALAINPQLTIIDGIIGHEGNGPSSGEPRKLGLLGASSNVFALDQTLVSILNVDPQTIPTIVAQSKLGLNLPLSDIEFPLLHPEELQIQNWLLPETMMPIDFALPRVLRSTFKHLYIRWIKEPIQAYGLNR